MVPISASLSDLPTLSLGVALVLGRVGTAVMLLPGIGEADPPPVLRIGLAVGLTVLIAPPLLHDAPEATAPLAEIGRALAREILCGLFLGTVARIVALALPVAAEIMTLMVGLTSVIQPDPELGAQSSGLARLFSLAAPVLLLSTGLYRMPIEAVADSYNLVPLGGELPPGDVTEMVVRVAAESFSCALRLAAPFVIAGLLWQVCLGLLTRFVPSMQAGAALMPGQLLGGLILLAVLAGTLLASWLGMTEEMFSGLFAPFHG